jgi:cysteine desulfurase
MLPFLGSTYANPSSIHQFGQAARHAVDVARCKVAEAIGAQPRELVFTSGGTESINLALFGALATSQKRRIVTTSVEHTATLNVAELLYERGYEVERVAVDENGLIDEAEWNEKLTPETGLASIMHANNETGVIFDIQKLAGIAFDRGIPVHVDAVQSMGKVPIDVSRWPVQMLSLSAHKFHGPKGVGALYVRKRTHLSPQIAGGNQERGLRGGTEHVAGIVGMGIAAEKATQALVDDIHRIAKLRDALENGILASIPTALVNGRLADRVCNTSNISFDGLQAEAILILLSEEGICASSGAACSSGSLEPSHVLKAMNLDERPAHGAIRFSLSRFNTAEEIDRVVRILPKLLSRLTVLAAR